MIAKELIKGTIRTIVLRLLSEHERMYGYEIMQTIDKNTNGKIKLNFGSLYPILHKLEADGLIDSESENQGKRVRKYYYLTSSGKVETKSKIAELKEFVKTLNGLMEGGVEWLV